MVYLHLSAKELNCSENVHLIELGKIDIPLKNAKSVIAVKGKRR